MTPYRGLILDLDGTVVDSHRYTFDAFRHACAPYREPPTDDEVFAAFGPSEHVILGRMLCPADLEPAYARLQEFYAAHAGSLAVHPAMRPLLGDCGAAGVQCGLFTGRGSDSTRLILERLDLAWAFGAVVAGAEARRPKPAPDGVLQLVDQLGCAPEETIVVGDSRLDLEAARAAGTAAAFASWHAWGGAGAPADSLVVRHPDELRPLLGLAGPGGRSFPVA